MVNNVQKSDYKWFSKDLGVPRIFLGPILFFSKSHFQCKLHRVFSYFGAIFWSKIALNPWDIGKWPWRSMKLIVQRIFSKNFFWSKYSQNTNFFRLFELKKSYFGNIFPNSGPNFPKIFLPLEIFMIDHYPPSKGSKKFSKGSPGSKSYFSTFLF